MDLLLTIASNFVLGMDAGPSSSASVGIALDSAACLNHKVCPGLCSNVIKSPAKSTQVGKSSHAPISSGSTWIGG